MAKNISTLIVGSGFIASNFNKYKYSIKNYEITIYAAGISNSLETNKINLKREISKIKSFLKKNKKKIVYISTYSILDKSRSKKLYIKNKINIEKIIKKQSQNYLIIRLPEIIGKNIHFNSLGDYSRVNHDIFKDNENYTYIGKSSNLKKRIQSHLSYSRSYKSN